MRKQTSKTRAKTTAKKTKANHHPKRIGKSKELEFDSIRLKLAKLIESQDRTLSELANEVGTTRQTLANYTSGRNGLGYKVFLILCMKLRVDPFEYLTK